MSFTTVDTSPKGQVAQRLLGDTEGFLVIDGYAGYAASGGFETSFRSS